MPSTTGTLYLIPNLLGGDNPDLIAPQVREIALSLNHFIVESVKPVRRYLKKLDRSVDIDAIEFEELPRPKGKYKQRMDANALRELLMPATLGGSVGLVSDAGCPAIADPGAFVVREAHAQGIRVVPLPGPCSITLALMASGMNGQRFAFHGYLPIDRGERASALRKLEKRATTDFATQIFMETPFRNQRLLETVVNTLRPDLRLCVAANLTLPDEVIITEDIRQWRKLKVDLHKKPAIYLLGSYGV